MDTTLQTLEALSCELFEHFDLLSNDRNRTGFPVFALEHGLDAEKRELLKSLLRHQQASEMPRSQNWLAWVVYASELGYGYTGDEYWTSFENLTPNWSYNDRLQIKVWFHKFQQSFNGVTPSGVWAEHFSIIAWPITHALLPRYLQEQFARLLYDLRFRLASYSLDAGSIGGLLAAHSNHASTRFRAFLEQEQLTGQIVVALLQDQAVESNELIHPRTLNRIVTDLEVVRNSREWLKETRHVVSDRFKGIRNADFLRVRSDNLAHLEEPNFSRFIVRPQLFLRYDGRERWSLILKLKSLRPVAAESRTLLSFLEDTRCRINGASDWKPRGWALANNRMGVLGTWPNINKPLIEFEESNLLIDHLLESEFRLDDKSVWLFKINKDGIAHYIESSVIRPNNRYIGVSRESLSQKLPQSRECSLACSAVSAVLFDTPDFFSDEFSIRMEEIGFSVARTIRIWPAGLPGRNWDGEGNSEWLTTESPCFAVLADHPIDALTFKLNDSPSEMIEIDSANRETFVRLSPLPQGSHILSVKEHRKSELEEVSRAQAAQGQMRLAVREPEPWIPGRTSFSGLIVTSDPYNASLNALWNNKVDIFVSGPDSFNVKIDVTLYDRGGSSFLNENVGTSVPLPITPDSWQCYFSRLLNNESFYWKHLDASSCTLEFNGESLGTCILRFEHDHLPVRWVLTKRQRQTLIRLVDDSGNRDADPELRFYSLDEPLNCIRLSSENARNDTEVTAPGGLYVAIHKPFIDAAFISVASARAGLQDLKVEPNIAVGLDQQSLRESFHILDLWFRSRRFGFLAHVKQRSITHHISTSIFKAICGSNWAAIDDLSQEATLSVDSIKKLETLVDKHTQFGRSLYQQTIIEGDEADVISHFFAQTRRYHVGGDRPLCEFAIRFANREFEVLSDANLDIFVSQISNKPALLRGARFVSLIRMHHSDPVD